jgi:molecular chaperone DnaJ
MFERADLRGHDLFLKMGLTLEEAFSGIVKTVTYNREIACRDCKGTGSETYQQCDRCKGTGKVSSSKGFFKMAQQCAACRGTGRKVTKVCKTCGGRGKIMHTESIKVRIPAGADTGSRIRLKGMGGSGEGSGPFGDLQIEITVKQHPVFTRKGDDLLIDVPVTFGEAALGAKIEVPTIDGVAAMTLPPGTQGSQRFKLSGKGFPSSKTGRRGDQFVDIRIAVPKDIPESLRPAVREIESLYKETPRKGLVKNK